MRIYITSKQELISEIDIQNCISLTRSGIYCIKHSNGKIYVGSACNLKKRFYKHQRMLRKNVHPNQKLQNTWNKYNEADFSFFILEYVDNQKELIDLEQTWIDKLGAYGESGFNLRPIAKNNLGFNFSDESRIKMRNSQLGRKQSAETIEKRASQQRGRKHTQEAIQKMRNAHAGKIISIDQREKARFNQLGKRASDDTKAKMSTAHSLKWKKRKRRAFQVVNPAGSIIIYESVKEYGKLTGHNTGYVKILARKYPNKPIMSGKFAGYKFYLLP